MKISIFGLGYVGAVTAGCLARQGHSIVGVDVHPQKVELFNQGAPPIVEPGLEGLLREAKAKGLLRATLQCSEAMVSTDVSIVCVGTPSTVTGSLDLSYVRQVLKEIRAVLRSRPKSHALVIRSTTLPGSTARLVSELLVDLEANGSLTVCYYPEFLREGSAVADFETPMLSVVGTRDGSRPGAALMSGLFGEKTVVVNWQTAEMLKYACNAFHVTKIAFANEIGRMAKGMQIDGRLIMDLLGQDTRLNVSTYYLQPGNPFGGPCLPKDVRALTHHGRIQGMQLPVLESLLPSNDRHQQHLLQLIAESGQREIIILGLSFKSETDDLRESPMVEVAQALLGRGYQVRIYDPQLNLARLVGSNKRVIDTKMPHLASLLHEDLRQALGEQGLLVAAQRCAPIADLARVVTPKHRILDVNGWVELRSLPARYEGFCW
jgi:GDP-mannose 6-dehydrogenase